MHRTSPRSAAFRVALVATLLGIGCYVGSVLVLNTVLVHRLTTGADRRLHGELVTTVHRITTAGGLPPRGSVLSAANVDQDDVPIYLWFVTKRGATQPLTRNAPDLTMPRGTSSFPRSLTLGSSTFRVEAVSYAGGRVVAGESLSAVFRVRTLLQIAELIFGAILLILMFGAAFVVGRRAMAPVAHAQRRQAEFTADASHELRTPLTVIEAEVEIALSQPRTAASYRATLERIGEESRRLTNIVDDLLWLARSDSPVATSGTGTVDLATAARACVDRLTPMCAVQGVELSLRVEGSDHRLVSATGIDIDRLLGVLIDNGAKFAATPGRVNVTVRYADHRLSLIVDDNGPGLSDSDTSRIFDRFHRTTPTTRGTGLGLAIADAVVRASAGTWHLDSSPLGGARFEVAWRRP